MVPDIFPLTETIAVIITPCAIAATSSADIVGELNTMEGIVTDAKRRQKGSFSRIIDSAGGDNCSRPSG